MSAFLVSNDHVRFLVSAAEKWGFITPNYPKERQRIGSMLINENQRSVNARYGTKDEAPDYRDSSWKGEIEPIQVLKAIACLDYQSCETDDWRQTPACKWLRRLQGYVIPELPGYDEAEWAIEGETIPKKGLKVVR